MISIRVDFFLILYKIALFILCLIKVIVYKIVWSSDGHQQQLPIITDFE